MHAQRPAECIRRLRNDNCARLRSRTGTGTNQTQRVQNPETLTDRGAGNAVPCRQLTLGGVLILGEKGTAKSTIVRALSQLLEGLSVIELPIATTEDKLVGSIDVEHALSTGELRFSPGILARAHKQILYVDEVNLLEDYFVGILLDVAAMGVNHI